MSSAVYLEFEEGIELRDWEFFCGKNDIWYSRHTMGRNVFYDGQVEIAFGRPNHAELPFIDETGLWDFDKAEPRSIAHRIIVSSYYMQNLNQITAIAKKIFARFGGTYTCDPELVELMENKNE